MTLSCHFSINFENFRKSYIKLITSVVICSSLQKSSQKEKTNKQTLCKSVGHQVTRVAEESAMALGLEEEMEHSVVTEVIGVADIMLQEAEAEVKAEKEDLTKITLTRKSKMESQVLTNFMESQTRDSKVDEATTVAAISDLTSEQGEEMIVEDVVVAIPGINGRRQIRIRGTRMLHQMRK